MYRNYEEYLTYFEEFMASAPEKLRLKKKTKEEFLLDNYRDKIEWYLMEEWNVPAFHDLFYGDCDFSDDESDELTPEEIRGEFLQNTVSDMIIFGFDKRFNVSQTASIVILFLLKEKILENDE